MKKILLILLLSSVNFTCLSQTLRDSVLVDKDIFKIVYSEKLEQPLRVSYKVLCQKGQASRQGMDFYIEKEYKTSDDKDYKNNIYDKGHCAPASNFRCNKETLYKTFTYLNCTLQNKYLNRGIWRLLEIHEKKLANKYSVDVEIKIIFSPNSVRLTSGATIPDAFLKIIKYNGITEKYFFINEKPKYSDFKKYKL